MNLTNLFDAFDRCSRLIHAEDEKQKALVFLRSRSARKCGNCDHWMKSRECPMEKNVGGMNRGPSMSHAACDQFAPTKDCIAASAELKTP